MDFICRYETYQEDLQRVWDRLGIVGNRMPHVKKSETRRPYQDYYTPETRDIIAQTYARDIELWGYSFDG